MTFAQLAENEQRYQSLFENNPDLVLFQNRAGTVLDANPASLLMLGRRKEEVLGRPFSDFLPLELHALFAQKLREAFEGHKVNFDAQVQFIGTEPPAKHLNVTKVPLLIDGAVAGVHVVARDVTDLFISHQIIRDQAQKLNTVFESITDAFFLIDRDWRFTYVNNEVERMLNVRREDVIGKNIWEVFPEEESGAFHSHYEQAMAMGQAAHFESYFSRGEKWFEVKAFPSKEGLSVYFSDITEKVKSQGELYRQNKDLQQFTYIVSHNLRAPLANALGLVDLLGSVPQESPDYTAAFDNLRTSVQQLDVVLRDMNTILSIRDQQDMAQSEQVLLSDAVQQASLTLQHPLREAGGALVVDVPANLRVRANRAYLHSVFINLLSNSVKYRASERPLRIEVKAQPQPDNGVEIVVADNGSGFDQERAGADVFRLYKRFHTGQSGRGMGLYLVKTHIEAIGGTIAVRSTVDVGTRFVIHLR